MCGHTGLCVYEGMLLILAWDVAVAARERAAVQREAGGHGDLEGVSQPGCIYYM